MWIKRLVGLTLTISALLTSYLLLRGIVFSAPREQNVNTTTSHAVTQGSPNTIPEIILSIQPSTVSVGSYSTITWSVTGESPHCMASDDWQGEKTVSGNASTGRLPTAKSYTYTLTCKNQRGESKKSTTVTVTSLAAP